MCTNNTEQNVQAEQAVLGSMLIDAACVRDVLARLREDDFALPTDGAIFAQIQRMYAAQKPIDAISVADAMRGENAEETAQIRAYIAELLDITPTSANALMYSDIVLQASRRRLLEHAFGDAVSRLREEQPEEEIIPEVEDAIAGARERMGSDLLSPMEQVERYFAHRERIDSGAKPYVRTGFRQVDRMLGGGMVDSGLYFLAARPGMGKSTFALNIAENVAKTGSTVIFISLEMDNEQITAKRLSAMTRASYQTALNDTLTEEEYQEVCQATVELSQRPLYVNSSVAANVEKITSMAHSKKGVRLVIVDHFSLIQTPGRHSRYEEYTNVSGALKRLARALKCPILCLAQLNRANDMRKDKRPMLSDLRDTGAAEQDADGVITLFRPDYYEADKEQKDGEPSFTELAVAKNRHGKTGRISLSFYPKRSIFKEVWCK